MIKLSKCSAVLVACFLPCLFLSCFPSSTYLNESEFEEMRVRCLDAIPDSYSLRLDSPENCYFIIDVCEGDASVEYYFAYGERVSYEVLSEWVGKQHRFDKSSVLLMDVKSIDDVFSYIRALYEDQLDRFKRAPSSDYLTTKVKYDDTYFYPLFFSCEINTTETGYFSDNPVQVTISCFSPSEARKEL